MTMYNLIEYCDNYSKKSVSLCKNCRDKPNNALTDSESFKFKSKFTNIDATSNCNVKMAAPLECLNNFWRIIEMSLINC